MTAGHWGTCPGLILVYSHLNYLVREHDMDMIYVVGPGHGAPAILAALWLEGSLGRFYPEYSRDRRGLHRLITKFSVTGGFPRYLAPPKPQYQFTDLGLVTSMPRHLDPSMRVVSLAMRWLCLSVQSWISQTSL